MKIKSADFIISNTAVAKCPKDRLPEYAFIGRSNVGKSSLINMLMDRKSLAKISGRPGKTQLINHFKINEEWFLVDLPGYGYAKVSKTKRKSFQSFIQDYFKKREQLVCTFVLIDSRHDPQKIDLDFMTWLGENQIPFVITFTKIDKLSSSQLQKNVKAYSYDGSNLPFEDNFFDRIIISHCLEHINNPEKFLFKMMSKLKAGGVLSISLPTDPGLLWRLGRLFIKYFIVKKTYNISKEEYEYINATEHINSIFNLISLIRYNFKNQIDESFLPFRIKLADLNLFYNVHITK